MSAESMGSSALHVELVAADRVVWSGESTEVIARTTEGDLGVLVGHAPLLSVLAPGVIVVESTDGTTVRAAVADGFLSVSADRVSVLSEVIVLPSDVDESSARSELEAAQGADDQTGANFAEAKLRLIAAS